MQKLMELSNLFFSLPTPAFKRYLFSQIDFKSKLIGILGQRGVGKTILMRQIAQSYDIQASKMLYISADNIVNSLSDIAIEFSSFGGELLIIDEIHKAMAMKSFLQDCFFKGYPSGFTQLPTLFVSTP